MYIREVKEKDRVAEVVGEDVAKYATSMTRKRR